MSLHSATFSSTTDRLKYHKHINWNHELPQQTTPDCFTPRIIWSVHCFFKTPSFLKNISRYYMLTFCDLFFCCSFGYSRSIILILLKSYIRLCKYKILLSGTFRDVMTWCSSEEFLWLYLGIAWYKKKSWCLQKWSLPTTLKPMFYFNSYTFK